MANHKGIPIPDDTLALCNELRCDMPLDDFLGYCIVFGAADVRDAAQQAHREYTAQRLQADMLAHQRGRAQRTSTGPGTVLDFTPQKKDDKKDE
jgi:hypothetical protein